MLIVERIAGMIVVSTVGIGSDSASLDMHPGVAVIIASPESGLRHDSMGSTMKNGIAHGIGNRAPRDVVALAIGSRTVLFTRVAVVQTYKRESP
jgi:hypothetical protein